MTNAGEPNHQYARKVADILDRAIATLNGYFELGNDVTVAARARLVRNIECGDVYDANHAGTIRAASPAEVDELIGAVDELFSEHAHRSFKVDARTPARFEARLLHDGYEVTPELQLILEGPLETTLPRVDIRPVASDRELAGGAPAHPARPRGRSAKGRPGAAHDGLHPPDGPEQAGQGA